MNQNIAQAILRGYYQGKYDKGEGFRNDSPLSGEWAGESIPELLGDLMDEDESNLDEICDAYEEGYNNAFDMTV